MKVEQKIQKVLELSRGGQILQAIESMEDADTPIKGSGLDLANPLHKELLIALRILTS